MEDIIYVLIMVIFLKEDDKYGHIIFSNYSNSTWLAGLAIPYTS